MFLSSNLKQYCFSSSFVPSSSSSLSSFLDSSMIEPLSVGVIQSLYHLEYVVQEDDPKGATDRLGSPEQSSPVLELDWVEPKVVEYTSTFLSESSVFSFLERVSILKSDVDDGILSVNLLSRVPFSFYTLVCFIIYTFPFRLMISRWASFKRSMWLLPNST